MLQKELLLRTQKFENQGLKLEDYIRLIYFDKTSFNFDNNLHNIISYLRKYSKNIKSIGYENYDNTKIICVKLLFDLDTISLEEINSIDQ